MQNAPGSGDSSIDEVAGYYDRNTARFLRFGGSGESAAIHRKVWLPGVKTAEQASLVLNQFVLEALSVPGAEHARWLDLGCGVGGTVTWLAQKTGLPVIGVTNSLVQAHLATRRAERLGLAEH
jgi:cyclopropane fatty-acyl-phospholipid synthase-like methyltransferase